MRGLVRSNPASEGGADPFRVADVTRHKDLRTLRAYDRRVNVFKDHPGVVPGSSGAMDETTRDKLRKLLMQYPGATKESVESDLDVYEEREYEKCALMERGLTNALAEAHLDTQGYPRPPDWQSVFFYPDSSRPRNLVVFWAVVFGLILLSLPR